MEYFWKDLEKIWAANTPHVRIVSLSHWDYFSGAGDGAVMAKGKRRRRKQEYNSKVLCFDSSRVEAAVSSQEVGQNFKSPVLAGVLGACCCSDSTDCLRIQRGRILIRCLHRPPPCGLPKSVHVLQSVNQTSSLRLENLIACHSVKLWKFCFLLEVYCFSYLAGLKGELSKYIFNL